MTPHIVDLDSIEKLNALVERSFEKPVFILKHSRTCGISADIFEQLGSLEGEINLIVVQDHRTVSNAVADRLAVRHASPQAFVIKNGEVTYHATHYGIDPRAIQIALDS
ncbi:MAG TPA: bacillithiol system redox-active protein YtxJ [Pyrinomonadaceae bacterium]|nr:bacillithiol system redox-active protein YtxJ [Pyrinomonadaceae bacterium]